MPLSEHEQRLLEQIERALYAEDPKFASTVSSTNLRSHARRRIWRAAVLLVVGVAALVAGAMLQVVWLGVVGFLVMFAAAGYAVSQSKRLFGKPDLKVVGGAERGGSGTSKKKARRSSFLQRMEERFKRRFDER